MNSIVTRVEAQTRDLGGFTVGRVLPSLPRRSVGPFVFLDHMGPVELPPGHGLDVRPHPHIGLSTVTYLFDGEILHRDSLGSAQVIRPGAINWMTAGRGIGHSERTPAEVRVRGTRAHGLQMWVGLPREHEEVEPSFHHHAADSLPAWSDDGVALRLLAGQAYARTAPVRTWSPLFYVHAELPAGASLPLPDEHAERAIYVVAGAIECEDEAVKSRELVAFAAGSTPVLRARGLARDAARRRAARRATPPVVELREQRSGAHRAGQARLGGGQVRRGGRRRGGADPTAGVERICPIASSERA